MKKAYIKWTILFIFLCIVVLLFIDDSRNFIFALLLRSFLFVKNNILTILSAFFLIKGKFVLKLFMKKIALLSVTGLGKRYIIEKVIMGNLKKHFLDHLTHDITRLTTYAKKNFKRFTLVKKTVSIFAFIGSLGFAGKFMGGMLALKIFIAKVWSFLLVIFLKIGTGIIYFFTDYLWGSWLAPIIEVIIFSWLLSWLEKIPFLEKGFQKIYKTLRSIFIYLELFLSKFLDGFLKKFFYKLRKRIQNLIHMLIGSKRKTAYQMLIEKRVNLPNLHIVLKQKRKRFERDKRKKHIPIYKQIVLKRAKPKLFL